MLSHSLKSDDDDLHQIASANRLKDKQLVLATVNNSREKEISSGPVGSHWSLLVFYRPETTVFYLDSVAGTPNLSISKLIAHRLSRMVDAPSAKIQIMPVPKQTNSYDCGTLWYKYIYSIIFLYRVTPIACFYNA